MWVCVVHVRLMLRVQDSRHRRKVGLEDFELIKVIGKGSFGKVTLVKKKVGGKLFAMKVLTKAHLERSKQVSKWDTDYVRITSNAWFCFTVMAQLCGCSVHCYAYSGRAMAILAPAVVVPLELCFCDQRCT